MRCNVDGFSAAVLILLYMRVGLVSVALVSSHPGGHLIRCRILTIFRVFVELKFGSIAIYLANHPAWIAHCKRIFGQTS